ncbi:hypothetical protein BZL30_5494 [Mycobacterium kansasii]|uniref:Uncharacterized protein n=1 Tax=Mycobacterium kansasii TaxID=1768 RepID=A0A1V3WXP0_MYCKA|nr:hypothetical protein BZL30_5494 [Mycobacterium kansasii]
MPEPLRYRGELARMQRIAGTGQQQGDDRGRAVLGWVARRRASGGSVACSAAPRSRSARVSVPARSATCSG